MLPPARKTASRSLARKLRLTRKLRFGWVQVGDHMLERFSLTNSSRFPAPWIEVVDHSTLPDYQANNLFKVLDYLKGL